MFVSARSSSSFASAASIVHGCAGAVPSLLVSLPCAVREPVVKPNGAAAANAPDAARGASTSRGAASRCG